MVIPHFFHIGSSYLALGVIGSTSFIAQTLSYFALPGLIDNCGYSLVTFSGITAIGVRYTAYSVTNNAWWFVLADSLKGTFRGRERHQRHAFMGEPIGLWVGQ